MIKYLAALSFLILTFFTTPARAAHYLNLLQYRNGPGGFTEAAQGVYSISNDDLYTQKTGTLTTNRTFPELTNLPDATRIEKNQAFSLGECKTLLSANQEFPLAAMGERGVIDPQFKDELKSISEKLDPDQILFIEEVSSVSGKDVWANTAELPPFVRPRVPLSQFTENYRGFSKSVIPGRDQNYQWENIPPDSERPSLEQSYRDSEHLVVKASIWSVSGQPRGFSELLPMERGSNPFLIDRKKYPLVWELGRAAHSDGASLNSVLKAAVLRAYLEMLSLGRSPQEMYFAVHTVSPAHARLYREKYGCEVIGQSLDKKEAWSIVSFEELQKKLEKAGVKLNLPALRYQFDEQNWYDPDIKVGSHFMNLRFHAAALDPHYQFVYPPDEIMALGNVMFNQNIFAERNNFSPMWKNAHLSRELLLDFHEVFYRMQTVEIRGLGRRPTAEEMNLGVAIAWNELVKRLKGRGIVDPAQWIIEKKMMFAYNEMSIGFETTEVLTPDIKTMYHGPVAFSILSETYSYDFSQRNKKTSDWAQLHLWKAEDVNTWLTQNPGWLERANKEADAISGKISRVKRNMRLIGN